MASIEFVFPKYIKSRYEHKFKIIFDNFADRLAKQVEEYSVSREEEFNKKNDSHSWKTDHQVKKHISNILDDFFDLSTINTIDSLISKISKLEDSILKHGQKEKKEIEQPMKLDI